MSRQKLIHCYILESNSHNDIRYWSRENGCATWSKEIFHSTKFTSIGAIKGLITRYKLTNIRIIPATYEEVITLDESNAMTELTI